MASAARLDIKKLPDGDASAAPLGAHVVLEAPNGALMHAVRMSAEEGLVALRSGSVRAFQIARRLPAAAVVRYPPPLGPSSAMEEQQAVLRAREWIGLSSSEVVERLVRAGADEEIFARGDAQDLVAECFAGFCVTGSALLWKVAEAYKAPAGPPLAEKPEASKASPLFASSSSRGPEASSGARNASSSSSSASFGAPLGRAEEEASDVRNPSSSSFGAPLVRDEEASRARNSSSSSFGAPLVAEEQESWFPSSSGMTTFQEKALHTALHAGLKNGAVAKTAGAVAAISCEGFNLYQNITEHTDQLKESKISDDQYQEKICESSVTSSGRVMGGLAGAAVAQAAIPVPVVGALVGGMVGAAAGGLHANSLVRGALRLSGSQAKGGDNLVRCVEHQPASETSRGNVANEEYD